MNFGNMTGILWIVCSCKLIWVFTSRWCVRKSIYLKQYNPFRAVPKVYSYPVVSPPLNTLLLSIIWMLSPFFCSMNVSRGSSTRSKEQEDITAWNVEFNVCNKNLASKLHQWLKNMEVKSAFSNMICMLTVTSRWRRSEIVMWWFFSFSFSFLFFFFV
jgi:hypothetical protein